MRDISILSIDYSGASTGLTFGRPGELPILMTKGWPDRPYAEVMGGLFRWIPEQLSVFNPDVVLLEAALHFAAQSGQASARMNLGGAAIILGACEAAGVRCIETKHDDWALFAHGTARLKREEGKARSKEIARAFGLEPRNDDEADSFCLWLYGMYKYAGFYTVAIQQVLAKAQRKLILT